MAQKERMMVMPERSIDKYVTRPREFLEREKLPKKVKENDDGLSDFGRWLLNDVPKKLRALLGGKTE